MCLLFHKWSKPIYERDDSQNIEAIYRQCQKCGQWQRYRANEYGSFWQNCTEPEHPDSCKSVAIFPKGG